MGLLESNKTPAELVHASWRMKPRIRLFRVEVIGESPL